MQDYSLLRWPCPEWFHVPISTEWQDIIQMIGSLWLTNNSSVVYTTYLKLQYHWYYDSYMRTKIINRGETVYRCCDKYNLDTNNSAAVTFNIHTPDWWTWIASMYHSRKDNWCSIRPFKDTQVIPDSSRTVLYDWSSVATWAWIYRDQINWLISISSDWFNWKTISDSDLSAATWSYFQRWNDYAFSWEEDMPWGDYSSRPNTQWFWPKNHYISANFITLWSADVSWDNPTNNDLWWYESFIAGQNDIYVWEWNYDHLELYVWNWVIKSLMRWPCQRWWHIPSSMERSWVTTIMEHIFAEDEYYSYINTRYYSQYLHLPISWCLRNWERTFINEQYWFYWCSTPDIADRRWYTLDMNNLDWGYNITCVNYAYRCRWIHIRPFKDEPIKQISGWARIVYKWEYAIYYNSTQWLISLTDWTNRYTISDKNLWATTVYNDWDTMSETNCWWFFQRWNNYMFSFEWTTNTSNATVDTTWYWPWNYYSSSTFIREFNYTDWSNPQNDNLRWWASQAAPNVAEVYKWTTLVRSNYQPTTPVAWVYWCPTKWMISLSDDWNEWITIADKNLWAKYCYEQWQTPSQDNMWYLFQWWNNFPFKYSWPIPTISDTDRWYRYPSAVVTESFATWTITWNKKNARWWDSPKLESSKWPCPDWFHVPTYSDMYFIVQKLTEWWLTNSAFTQYLKMPDMWFYSERAIKQTSNTYYLTCTHERWVDNTNKYCAMLLRTTNNYTVVSAYDNLWCPIRPFKNDYVNYSTSYKIYSYDDDSWIWYNQSDWLITIWDKYRRITIADKNLWATQVWNEWDTKSQTNCWWYFQRWNNNMFSYNWPTYYGQIRQDVTWYWPWNYYSNNYFVTRRDNWVSWMQDINYNLRWWDDIDYEKAIWPCWTWWHIATYIELNKIISILNSYSDTYEPKILLKAPTDGNMIFTQWSIATTSGVSFRWCSQAENRYYMLMKSNGSDDVICVAYPTVYWYPIRPFKNEPSIPNDTSRIKLA